MKGDFTRFTFQPEKRYTSVLMQQGRLQLDADWNEQMSILGYLNQTQARDMIGASAGTSETEGGFQLLPTPDNTDLIIREGRFYLGGLLCELRLGTPISVKWLDEKTIQVPFVMLDGLALAKDQWIEITGQKFKKRIKILKDDLKQQTLELAQPVPKPTDVGETLQLRRLITYKTQPEYTNPPTPSANLLYLVYLDLWQRHVTVIDDPELREVALNGIDTTTRLKTIAQVKLLDITEDIHKLAQMQLPLNQETGLLKQKPPLSTLENLPAWQKLLNHNVWMTASTALDPTSSNTLGNYLCNENRLYRVEIHADGTLEKATFKWSRDNGSIVSAVKSIEGNVIKLKGQEEYKLFADPFSQEKPWIEIISEAQELHNQPGILVRLKELKPPNQLLFDQSQVQGIDIPKATPEQAEQQKLKVRRWDGKDSTSGDWKVLEEGIKVRFNTTSLGDEFRNGDFWLIPARAAGKQIEWPRDLAKVKDQPGEPLPQKSAGIEHRYAILALVKTEANTGEFVPAIENDDWTQSDLRIKFPPLINCFDKNTGYIDGSFGIGIQPEARLHVRGNATQTAQGKISTVEGDRSKIAIADTNLNQILIYKGYTLTVNGKTKLVTDVDINGVLTVDPPFDTPLTEQLVEFQYQQPVIRFESSAIGVSPQFFLNPQGNIGIGTFNPAAKLEIRSIPQDQTPSLLHIKNATGASLLNVQTDGKVGIGIEQPQANLEVKGILKTTTGTLNPGFLEIQPQDNSPVNFRSNAGYSFDNNISIASGGLTITQGSATIANDVTVKNGNIKVQTGSAIINNDVTVQNGNLKVEKGSAAIANGLTIQNGGMTVKGNVQINEGTLTIGTFQITSDGLQFNQPITFGSSITVNQGITARNGISIPTGDVNIGTGILRIGSFQIRGTAPQFSEAVGFNNGITINKGGATISGNITCNFSSAEKLTLRNSIGEPPENSPVIDLPNQRLSIQSGANKLITFSPLESTNNIKLNICGSAVIGKEYVNRNALANLALDNGLLVEGDVGIGVFDTTPPVAKLEVRSTSDANKIALNITKSNRDSLFYVRNDGQIGIGTGGLNPLFAPVFDSSIPPAAVNQTKLYVKGNAYVDGNIFVKKVTGGTFTSNDFVQISSRTLKENIANLSSQEAVEMLKALNPVKFNYTIEGDDRTPHAGFIAEEVPSLLASSDHQAVRLLDVIAVLTKTVKDQREMLISLAKIVKQQQQAIATLTDKLNTSDK
ncbi:MAG: tail fiber domain-containing protein [Komarekiella atlantica HA4396-MV6]|jgi:hypothetical protein|nr:tail fiber domain-containing protein [Komarekiella atlantica HA4396-MV6]